MEDDTILEMHQITKVFPGVRALDNVNFSVRRGEVHAICGENGAGKSTLMKVLSGLYQADGGHIVFDGTVRQFRDIGDSEAAGIAIIHQELALIPDLSVAENIFLGNEITSGAGIDWVATRARARELMSRVGLSADVGDTVRTLGVGKQQLIEICKALNKDAKLLILDEPTAALNEGDSAHLLNIIRDLNNQGMSCVIISHKLNEIEAIADSVTIIRDGQSVETLNVADGVDEDRIIRGMVGRSLSARFPDHTPKIGEIKFEVHDWNVRHPDVPERWVCQNSEFHIRAGEIVGFAGLMGAGRTELARSIFGRSYGIYESGEVIAYDRLIMNSEGADYYVAYDNYHVGELQGEALLQGLEEQKGEPPYNVELIAGSPDDANSTVFFEGAMSILQPKIDDGTLEVASGQTTFDQAATQGWKAENAQKRFDTLLQANYGTEELQGVLSPNDTLARAALTSVEAAGKPVPVVTGQDSEKESVKLIMEDTQYSTINKDTTDLVAQTVSMVNKLQAGEEPEVNDTESYDNGVKVVPSYLLEPVLVTKANAQDEYQDDPVLKDLVS